jgi:glycine cleavage system H protein
MMDGNIASVGITDWAQGELGDVVYVELPEVGSDIKQGEPFGTIEAVKAVSDLYSPLSGKVIEINETLDDDPMAINREPYADGWMIKVELDDLRQLDQLLDANGYSNLIAG